MLFDTTAAFVPGINPQSGKDNRIIGRHDHDEVRRADLIKCLPAIFSPLECFFGCNPPSNDFNGTIFRFALWTEEQATRCRGSAVGETVRCRCVPDGCALSYSLLTQLAEKYSRTRSASISFAFTRSSLKSPPPASSLVRTAFAGKMPERDD